MRCRSRKLERSLLLKIKMKFRTKSYAALDNNFS